MFRPFFPALPFSITVFLLALSLLRFLSLFLQFKVDYVGAVPVASSSLSPSLWKMFGMQVIDDVGKKLKKLNPKPMPAVRTPPLLLPTHHPSSSHHPCL